MPIGRDAGHEGSADRGADDVAGELNTTSPEIGNFPLRLSMIEESSTEAGRTSTAYMPPLEVTPPSRLQQVFQRLIPWGPTTSARTVPTWSRIQSRSSTWDPIFEGDELHDSCSAETERLDPKRTANHSSMIHIDMSNLES